MKKPLLLILMVLGLALLGADAGIYQSLENADDLSIGDRFIFNIRADYALNQIEIPDTLTNFKVIDSQRQSEAGVPDWFRLTIVPILPGYHSFPALKVVPKRFSDPIAYTDRFRVNIIPVRAEADTTLVDIKPPLAYPFQMPGWAYLLMAGLLIPLLVLYLLLRPQKPRREAQKEVSPAPVKLPHWRVALEKLDALISENLVQHGFIVWHHFRLAEILRTFLEQEYRIPAIQMTSSEIRLMMQRIAVLHSAEVNIFLAFCDRAKFARHVPWPEETHDMESWLRNYLLSFEIIEAKKILDTPRGGTHAQLR